MEREWPRILFENEIPLPQPSKEGQVDDLTLLDPMPDQALLEFFLPSRKAAMESSGRKNPLICSFAGTAPKAVR